MKIRPVWSDDPRYRLPWSIGSVNAFYAGFCAAIPAIAGSLLTFLYYVSAVWVVINALYRRYTLRLPRRALPFAIACGSYFLIILATGLMADNRDRLFYSMFPMLTLPFVPLVIARFRIAAPDRSWRMFVRYAPLGAVAGVASVLLTGNQEGGAGNPNIFAVIMAVLAIYSLAGIEGGTLPRKLTALAGYICGVAGVILADARTLAILMPVLPFVFLIVGGRFSSRWILGLGLALILGVVLYWNALANELALTVADLQGQLVHRSSTSVGIRLSLWSASLEAIQSSPFIGHGIQNKMSVVVGLMDENLRWIKYSHVHNAYLDAMVAGGIGAGIALIALLISPLAMVFGYAHEQSDRRFVVVALVILFMVRGLTGNLLTQDLLVVTLLFSFIMPAMCDPENRDLTLRRGNGAHLP